MHDLIFLKPVFKTMIWGGSGMRDFFGYDIPADNTGECWAISAHPNGDCEIAEGEFRGLKLSQLWDRHPEVFGNYDSDRFPLLLKVIDAGDDLSIQVHPDDAYAKVHENGSLGKTECWYILDCKPGSTLVVGHNAKSKEELCKLIDEHRFKELIREVPVKKGDFVQIDPGTVHAIKGGVMILETQQSSDITYRVYDYDRLQNGKPRELHVEQSKEVIRIPGDGGKVMSTNTAGSAELVSCPYYRVFKHVSPKKIVFSDDTAFSMATVIEGEGTVTVPNGTHSVAAGVHFIVPHGQKELEINGEMTLIISEPVKCVK